MNVPEFEEIKVAGFEYGAKALEDDPSFKNDEMAWAILGEHFMAGVNWLSNLAAGSDEYDPEEAAINYSREELGDNVFNRPDHKYHVIAIQNDFKAGVTWLLDQQKEREVTA